LEKVIRAGVLYKSVCVWMQTKRQNCIWISFAFRAIEEGGSSQQLTVLIVIRGLAVILFQSLGPVTLKKN
jgi:hypothetical protein